MATATPLMPRTPVRKAGLSTSRPTTPVTPMTGALVRARRPAASASPQVKAALAAARANHLKRTADAAPPPPAPSFTSAMSTPGASGNNPTPGGRTRRRSSVASTSGISSSSRRSSIIQDEALTELEWGLKSVKTVIEAAKKTGRLNLSSRSLSSIPPLTYSLLPLDSSYHPSNREPLTTPDTTPTIRRMRSIDYATVEEEQAAGVERVEWFERADLTGLYLANNEITVVEEGIGGFEELAMLDLHSNRITSLPLTISLLSCLTNLNLSSNNLQSFPLQLLALENLTDLNLSSNSLENLWGSSYVSELDELLFDLRNPTISPSASPVPLRPAKLAKPGLWDSCPSSPSVVQEAESILNRPLPRLRKLSLASNRFGPTAFTEGFEFPPGVIELDLSENSIETVNFGIKLVGGLQKLERLILYGNDLGDEWFKIQLNEEEGSRDWFPSLKHLDLSRCAFDELGHFDEFSKEALRRKKIEWIGLPKIIMNLVLSGEARASGLAASEESEGKDEMELLLTNNPLGKEQARRRATFPPTPSSSRILRTQPPLATATPIPLILKRVVKEQWEIEAAAGLTTEAGRRKARIEAARKAREEVGMALDCSEEHGLAQSVELLALSSEGSEGLRTPTLVIDASITPPPPPYESSGPSPDLSLEPFAIVDDPTLNLILDHLSPEGTLSLASKALSTLPLPLNNPQTHSKSPSPTSIDLSSNCFDLLPFASVMSWNFAANLRKLDLSRNEMTCIDLLGSQARFEVLEELSLSHAGLKSEKAITCDAGTGSTTPLLPLLSTTCPNLSHLDLSYNSLTTLQGLKELLIPSTTGKKGLKYLSVRGNQVGEIEELCEVARILGSAGAEKGSWACQELDLQDNLIARLPTVLGLLPSSTILLVAGNPFRIPRSEVYINGGPVALMNWLKERAR